MKTTDYAIDFVYTTLKGKSGVPSALYKLEKPSNTAGTSYVVINALPIDAGVLQFCRVNVNCHVQDLSEGIPDMNTLKTVTASVLTQLEQVNSTTSGIFLDFESQQFFKEPQLNEHYSNIRIFCKILNS
jgi:hypothetical protein